MLIILYLSFFIIITISIFLGRGKSLVKQKLFLTLSSFLILIGIITSFLIKSIFLTNLRIHNELYDYVSLEFINWALNKFNSYFKWSYLYVLIVLGVLLYNLYTDHNIRNRESLKHFNYLCVTSMVVILTGAIIYSFSSINKVFDIPLYLEITAFSQIFILYIPLVAMRLYIGNPEVQDTIFEV
ncbi:hypothetical protein ACQR3C_08800 [Clostridium perfringens]|uniref:hypothetical protein n=1 Tax=Clostridium perfringens TaxID=1502 RepID=UPI002976B587|nr:hypothetical protein [Clostridium perfringens]